MAIITSDLDKEYIDQLMKKIFDSDFLFSINNVDDLYGNGNKIIPPIKMKSMSWLESEMQIAKESFIDPVELILK